MGVRVIEADAASASSDEECSKCHKKQQQQEKDSPKAIKSKRNTQKLPQTGSTYISKDLVGNCKEYRIEHNTKDLRIIGNGNRIRIVENSGNLDIIGNGTKLKIENNNGSIKYTGNDGRIYLGKESVQQTVNYIGCNGLLKVVKTLDLQGGKENGKPRSKAKSKSPPSSPSVNVEIDNNLVINGLNGNILVKNAINVSI
ncbi:uncharacterized protein pirk [Drosophila tropicalis]|uniref:uncharacterized protein pirk n=1 Tax=Drosophila tropicalis TaxID=46794 RepID=UPI0035AB6D3E